MSFLYKRIIVIIIISLLIACGLFKPSIEPETTYINEYNPQKAGAEIIAQYNVPKGLFANRQNDLFYMICENKILCFDISADELNIQREINFDTSSISDNPLLYAYGFADFGDKLIFLASCDKYGDDKMLLSVSTEGGQISYSEDVSADLGNAEALYYDDANDILFLSIKYKYYDRSIISCCKKDLGNYEEISKVKYDESVPTFFLLSDKAFCATKVYQDSSWCVHFYLHFYMEFVEEKYTTVELGYLNLDVNNILSVFSDDDGNIWLYVREYDGETKQDKYELLKLKLLE